MLIEGDEAMPVTSYLCQWKAPRKRKASTMPMFSAVFQKHDHQKQHKKEVSHTEDFDPHPVAYKGIALGVRDLVDYGD